MQHLTPVNGAWYLAVINLMAFAAFGIDKRRARLQARRTPEAQLIGLALAGGSPGAYAGRHLFRHKTRKQPFSGQLHAVAALQIAALCLLAAYLYR